MKSLHDRLSEGLESEDSAVVGQWLAGLSPAVREELETLWDRRADACSQSSEVTAEGKVEWHALPIVRGRFVKPGEVADDEEWRADHLEYLLDHPEIWVGEEPAELRRIFHIGCTAHQKAREVLAAGLIPADFVCPLDDDECPLRAILKSTPGSDFRLTGASLTACDASLRTEKMSGGAEPRRGPPSSRRWGSP